MRGETTKQRICSEVYGGHVYYMPHKLGYNKDNATFDYIRTCYRCKKTCYTNDEILRGKCDTRGTQATGRTSKGPKS